MPNAADLIQPDPDLETPNVQAAVVKRAPVDVNDSLAVAVPSFDPLKLEEVRLWTARGGSLPAVGDECLLAYAEDGEPWMVAFWSTAGNDPGGDYDPPIPQSDVSGLVTDLAAKQPLDADLTALAALSTTTFGRSLLVLADAAAGRSAFGLGTAATHPAGDFDSAGAAAAAQAASQPLDSDLTALAALTTTTFGRSLLELADAAAARTALGLGTAATHPATDFDSTGAAAAAQAASQPLDSDLTAIASLSTTSFGRGLLALADAAALRSAGGALAYATGTHAARLAAAHSAGTLWKESDTGLVYYDDGAAWTMFDGNGRVVKAADETVNNSATLQDDDHLFFPIEANEVWWVEGVLRVQGASTTADLQVGWTGPTGATAQWSSVLQGVATASDPGNSKSLATTATFGLRSAANGAVPPIVFEGWFFADSSHAGNIQMQWAQNAATVEDTKVLKHSFLLLRRLA